MIIRFGISSLRLAEEQLASLVSTTDTGLEIEDSAMFSEPTVPDHLTVLGIASWASKAVGTTVRLPLKKTATKDQLAVLVGHVGIVAALRCCEHWLDVDGLPISADQLRMLQGMHGQSHFLGDIIGSAKSRGKRSVSLIAEKSDKLLSTIPLAGHQFSFADDWGRAHLGTTLLARGNQEFCQLIATVIAELGSAGFRSPPDQLSDAVGTMLFEVFENAHLHGSCDRKSTVLRSEYFYGLTARITNVARFTGETPPPGFEPDQLPYLYQLFKSTDANELSFIEFVVFDSGIGMVERFIESFAAGYGTARFLPYDRQHEIVERCFRLHETSRNEGTHFGVGLARVLRHLRKSHAFLRLRTEGVFCFTNFCEKKLETSTPGFLTRALVNRNDGRSDGTVAPTRGTFVSVTIPILW